VSRPLVLIVEDDPDLRALVAALVGTLDVDTVCAEHGLAALEAMEKRQPDLVVLDMKMPVMDGWAYCDQLARRPGPRPPILVVTAAPDVAGRAEAVGAAAWLEKPFEPDDLLSAVERLLHATPA
jgi:urea transport system substrate-binding protein